MTEYSPNGVPYSEDLGYQLMIRRTIDQMLLLLEMRKQGFTSRNYGFELRAQFGKEYDNGNGDAYCQEALRYLSHNHRSLEAFNAGKYAFIAAVGSRTIELWTTTEEMMTSIQSGIEEVIRDMGEFDKRTVMVNGYRPTRVHPEPVTFERYRLRWWGDSYSSEKMSSEAELK